MEDDTAHGQRRLPSIAGLIQKRSHSSQRASLESASKDVVNDLERGSHSSGSFSDTSKAAAAHGLRRLSAHSKGVMNQQAANTVCCLGFSRVIVVVIRRCIAIFALATKQPKALYWTAAWVLRTALQPYSSQPRNRDPNGLALSP